MIVIVRGQGEVVAAKRAQGFRPASRAIAVLGLGLALIGGVAGCATKGDVRNLRRDVASLRVRHDSLFRESQRQTRLLLDTLRSSFAIQQDVRGETSHRFQQLEQMVSQLREMLDQTQLLIAQLNDRLERQMAGTVTVLPGAPAQAPVRPGAAENMYSAAMQKLGEGSYATARLAFEELLRQYPNDPRAPEAQYEIGETYYFERQYDRAIAAHEKVEQQWPRAPRAAEALLRAGVIAQERRQTAKARELFNKVLTNYPASDAAAEARKRLNR